MEEACAPPDSESNSQDSFRDGDNDEEEEEDAPEMRTYTVGELLRNTVQSYKDRGWEEEDSSGSVPRKKSSKKSAGGGERKKRQCRRVWNPEGEYSLVRSGPPLLYEDPDECIAHLTEKSLTIFKHNDPTVVYGQDPERPLWKGVFRMAVGGYGKDEYYDPKRTHFKAIYSADFPKKNRPADNMQVTRDGVTELPYWVDEWHHAKLSEKGHKQKSKKKLQAKSRIALEAEMRPDTPTVLAPVENVIFPLAGWFKQNLAKKGKTDGQQQGLYPYSLSLLADAAKKTAKQAPSLVARLGPVGTVAIKLPVPGTVAPAAETKPKAASAPTTASKAEAPKKAPVSKKRVINDDEDEEDEPAPEKKVKFVAHAPVAEAATAAAPQKQKVVAPPTKAHTPTPTQKQQHYTQLISDVMHAFYDAASAGMATPGTYYYTRLCEAGATYEEFFGPGGSADCVIPIAQMLLKRME